MYYAQFKMWFVRFILKKENGNLKFRWHDKPDFKKLIYRDIQWKKWGIIQTSCIISRGICSSCINQSIDQLSALIQQDEQLGMWTFQSGKHVYADSERACFWEHSDTVEQAGLVINQCEDVETNMEARAQCAKWWTFGGWDMMLAWLTEVDKIQ